MRIAYLHPLSICTAQRMRVLSDFRGEFISYTYVG